MINQTLLRKSLKEIYNRGPISCGIAANPLRTYTTGIIADKGEAVDHVISVVGWGHDEEHGTYWKVRNSWGEYWGELGYVPQKLGLVRHASVMHNVMIGAKAGHSSPWDIIPSSSAKKKALEAISSMGLTDKSGEPVRRLSGGQQRRVATARTLAQSPKLIMADEFLSELDEETMQMVLDSVTEYVRESGAALLVVEHDITRAKSMADRLLVIDDGRINPFITEITALEVKL